MYFHRSPGLLRIKNRFQTKHSQSPAVHRA
jgi:hypothetical protein